MKNNDTYHLPVLLNETVELLNVRPGNKYIDATLGGGGHSEEILRCGGVLLGIDQDPEAINFASKRIAEFYSACPPAHFNNGRDLPPPVIARGNFSNIDMIARQNKFDLVDGILFDLGVSGHQFETAERGFSFSREAFLDMRMDPDLKVTAKDLVNGLTEKELADLFEKLGGEKQSKKLAKAIVLERKKRLIEKTDDLAGIILKSAWQKNKFSRIHPATKVFQALRIAVNDELNNLRSALPKALSLLKKDGRIVVLSFHSLEDKIVKDFFLENEGKKMIKILTKKPIVPSKEEIFNNSRSRSAKLRGVQKL